MSFIIFRNFPIIMYGYLLPKNRPEEIKPKFFNKKLKLSKTFDTISKYSSYLSPKCSFLVKNEKKKISIYDTSKGTLLNTIETQIDVLGVNFISDETKFFLHNDKIIQKWDLKSFKLEKEVKITETIPKGDQFNIHSINGLKNSLYILIFESFNNSYQLLEYSQDDKIKVKKLDGKEFTNISQFNASYDSLTFLCEKHVILYSIKDEKILEIFTHHFKPIKPEKSIVYSHNIYSDQERIYTICQDDYVYMWDIQKKKDLYFQAPIQEDSCFCVGEDYIIYPTCDIFEDEKEKFDSPFGVYSLKDKKMIGTITYKPMVVAIGIFEKKIYVICEDKVFIWEI